jgi:uncharacterized protein (DUF2235 family)
VRRLIVCCDGTWNAPEKLEPDVRFPTNVLKIARAIWPVDKTGVSQIIEYVRGIGTGNVVDRVVGGASGKGITSNILQAYQFISNNFQRGDHIYLFGFSRGAYTARSLSGFIYHFGILKKEYQHLLPIFYDLYQRTPKDQLPELVAGYAEKIDRDGEDQERHCIPIQFIGVWDTVGALGVPVGLIRHMLKERIGFHDTELAPNVTYAYHALAIHEYRVDFPPTLWTAKRPGQTVEQVWFPGAHSDVGGGQNQTGLSDIALQWMAEKAMRVGLEMKQGYLLNTIRANALLPVANSRTGLYVWLDPYVRPIGPSHTDEYKPRSLDEFRHVSVRERLENMPSDLLANRLEHEIESDRRSDDPQLSVAP